MSLRNYFVLFLVALSFPFTYTKAQFRTSGGSSSSSVQVKDTPPYVPYVVAIYEDGIYACTGSLITLEYVVKSLQCVRNTEAQRIRVKAGLNSISQTGQVCEVASVLHEPVTGSDYIDIGIIQLKTPFDKKPTVGAIKLCTTKLTPRMKMDVSGFCSGLGLGDNIRSTRQIIGEMKCFAHTFTDDTGRLRKGLRSGYVITADVDSGSAGVVSGALCAVVGSYSQYEKMLYIDLSVESPARLFIKEKTGCT